MDGPVQELTRQAVQHGLWLKDLFVFLAATALVVPLFHRARSGAVAGFLLVGVAVGPYGLGRLSPDYDVIRLLTIEDKARVQPFAELGVMFLLFLIGLELSFSRLWSLRRFVRDVLNGSGDGAVGGERAVRFAAWPRRAIRAAVSGSDGGADPFRRR